MAKKVNKKIYYDSESDALWFKIKKGVEFESKEISPGVNIELGKNGDILGIEILNASEIFSEIIVSDNYKESIKEARAEAKRGETFTHKEVFGKITT